MESIQQLVTEWWVAADASTHMAVIIGLTAIGIWMVFSIIGMHTNPMRKPHNEMDFRQFAEARLAAAQTDRLSTPEPKTDQPEEEAPEEAVPKSEKRAAPLWRRL